jgi:hypothetical protein
MFQPQMPYLTDHSIPSNKRRGGSTEKEMVKAAIRPYSDVKYCTVQEIGAICQCEKKFIKRGPLGRQRRSKSERGRPSIPEAKSCVIVGNEMLHQSL